MKPITAFSNGFGFLFEGLNLVRKTKGMMKWILIPLILDFAMLLAGLYFGFAWIEGLITYTVTLLADPGNWLFSLLYYPLLIILGFGFFVVLLYGTFILSTIIASPFNSLLAEKALVELGAIAERPFHLWRWIKISVRMVVISLIRATIFLFFGIFIFVLSFFPGLNFLGTYIALLIIASDSADYSFEVLEMSLADRFKFIGDKMPQFSGMAASLGLTLLLPGLTLLILPLSVVGASCIVAKNQSKI